MSARRRRGTTSKKSEIYRRIREHSAVVEQSYSVNVGRFSAQSELYPLPSLVKHVTHSASSL
ncbi:Pyruvate dehydrogenase phosphatase regulatory subunit, mitochondrial, partial [Clarias magur]